MLIKKILFQKMEYLITLMSWLFYQRETQYEQCGVTTGVNTFPLDKIY